jgi:hypothetical protein
MTAVGPASLEFTLTLLCWKAGSLQSQELSEVI